MTKRTVGDVTGWEYNVEEKQIAKQRVEALKRKRKQVKTELEYDSDFVEEEEEKPPSKKKVKNESKKESGKKRKKQIAEEEEKVFLKPHTGIRGLICELICGFHVNPRINPRIRNHPILFSFLLTCFSSIKLPLAKGLDLIGFLC